MECIISNKNSNTPWKRLLAISVLAALFVLASAISAAATAKPPSERSWHDWSKPSLMAFLTALKVRLASFKRTCGTELPKNPWSR